MAKSTGIQLAQGIRQKIAELRSLCEKISEDKANRAPAGRWSPKQILSHLLGPEGPDHLPIFQAFLQQEVPRIDLEPGNHFFSEKRARMTVPELIEKVAKEYERVCTFTESLSAEQLDRKAYVPVLKDSPLGEYPTLESLIIALGESHIQFHIEHMKEILRDLGAPAAKEKAR